jgi:hypothetical protein
MRGRSLKQIKHTQKKRRKKKFEKKKEMQSSPNPLKQHHVYIVRRPFYGWITNTTPKKLKLFTREEVKDKVKEAFNSDVAFSSSTPNDVITQDTTLLIVPDHWDRRLPLTAKQYNLAYLPFSFILHPNEINKSRMLELEAPPDAEARVILQEQQQLSQRDDTFVLDKIPEDDMIARFQNWRFSGAKKMAPMKMQEQYYHHAHHPPMQAGAVRMHSQRKPSVEERKVVPPQPAARKSSLRKTSLSRRTPQKKTISFQASANPMGASSSGVDNVDYDYVDHDLDDEYNQAWSQLISRIERKQVADASS